MDTYTSELDSSSAWLTIYALCKWWTDGGYAQDGGETHHSLESSIPGIFGWATAIFMLEVRVLFRTGYAVVCLATQSSY